MRSFLAETIDHMGFKSSEANPDAWMRPAIKLDGEEYYEYIQCYVNDALGISLNVKAVLQEIQRDLNEIRLPDFYLGRNLESKE